MFQGKIYKRIAATAWGLFLLKWACFSQPGSSSFYPQGYFGSPLGIPLAYSANFGELRPNHWHMGFDFKTNQKQNLPVFAAADGYVAHVGVRALSFGRFMIIRHPNGYSTLYAHLKEFFPALEKRVKEKQIEKESWAIELDFPSTEFVVKKGDFIARSGNSGASQGPHLHFEILNTQTGRSVNPSLFGFPIRDHVPPVIKQLALYNRTTSTYFQNPQIFKTIRTDSGYSLSTPVIVTGSRKLSVALETYDQVNGVAGKNGIYGARLYFDNQLQIQFWLNELNYQESNYINAHLDKRTKNRGGPYLQHISRLPGFRGSIYSDSGGNGILELSDTLPHIVKIEVFDADKNYSILTFRIQYKDTQPPQPVLRIGRSQLVPGVVNVLHEKEMEVFMPENCFYDTLPSVYLKHNIFLPGAQSALHQWNDPQYPVHSPFSVRIKPTRYIPGTVREKVVMVREWQKERSVKKAQEQNGWYAASFADFGNFQLFIDTTSPKILPPVKEKDTLDFSALTQIRLRPTDNFGIKSFRAELFTDSAAATLRPGKWLMFSNDKARDYIYVFDEQWPYGVHRLKIQVEDLVGNWTEKTWWVKRYPYIPSSKKLSGSKRNSTNKKMRTIKK